MQRAVGIKGVHTKKHKEDHRGHCHCPPGDCDGGGVRSLTAVVLGREFIARCRGTLWLGKESSS